MIPFSDLIQAVPVSGSASLVGEKGVGLENRFHGLQDANEPMTPFDDGPNAFLERIRELMDSDGSLKTDGENVLGHQISAHEPDLSALDQLHVPVGDAVDQPPVELNDSQSSNVDSFEDGQNMVLPEIFVAIGSGHGERPSGDTHDRQSWFANQTMPVTEKNPPAGGFTPLSDDSPLQPKNTNGAGHHGKGSPFAMSMGEDNASIEGIGKENSSIDGAARQDAPVERSTPFSSKPANELEMAKANPVAQQRLPLGSVTSEKGTEPAPVHPHPIAGQTEEPESIRTLPTALAEASEKDLQKGQLPGSVQNNGPEPARSNPFSQDTAKAMATDPQANTASSEDNTANTNDEPGHSRTRRSVLADTEKTEFPKDGPLDSMKAAGFEAAKSNPSLHDTEKAVALEPTTVATEKSTSAQAAASTRAELPTEKTFQTSVMDQIVDKAAMRSINGRSEIQIRLKPEFLGNVQMNISTDKEQVVVRILTDQAVVKDIIETHLHQLKAELQNHGLTIDKFHVMVNPDAEQHHNREQFSQMFKNNSSLNDRRQAPDQSPEQGNPGGGNDADDDQPDHDGVNYFA